MTPVSFFFPVSPGQLWGAGAAPGRWIEFGAVARPCLCRPDSVRINMDVFFRLYRPARWAAILQRRQKEAEAAAAAEEQARQEAALEAEAAELVAAAKRLASPTSRLP